MAIPYKNKTEGKKKQVASMFDSIAHRYDFLNHFLSAGIDKRWRKKGVKLLREKSPKLILDIATGTGDFAIEALSLRPEKVTGVDISAGMLRFGREKLKKKGLENKIELLEGDSENLQFEDNYFDAEIVAFGVRNFENLEKGLREMNRVLKKSGNVVILEFSKPRKFPIKQLYNLYFLKVLPMLGRFFSKDKSAYSYLPESVGEFPDGMSFISILEKCGFTNCREIRLTFGIASIYFCEK
ncbi:MAG: bifunctional demethylmenaquinone methyltransferase/2-methoxy-6-polyprenyl-1,4-benzoquinol methylase UbiE [Bacteroidota bacterium]|nr:bifunctional demethylmenaquinone methyltransferase/2-methoxy-6-polyprenyl-1,4-benzoquinol methylase UbiE [Bacteroidota bacterium]